MQSIFVDDVEYKFFNHAYAISREGEILKKLAPMKPVIRNDGYAQFAHTLLHRAVAKLWLDPVDGAKVVHHKDGNKLNNAASNLEWCSQKEHMGVRHHGAVGKYIRTEETRAKLRAFRTGFKDTPEVAAKKRETLDAVCPKRECEVDGVKYRSIRQASIALGIHVCTVRQRCLSKNFPNYKLGGKTSG